MAVTDQDSTQVTTLESTGNVQKLDAAAYQGTCVDLPFDFTQGAAAGDATSTVDLCILPPGDYLFLGPRSWVVFSAFGAARTLDIGWRAYTAPDGTAVAVSAGGINAAIDVSAAGILSGLGGALANSTGRKKLFSSKTGVKLFATVNVSTIPAAATLSGSISIMRAG